ncbi:unnamed protein product [Leptidea sinapis]|uniref:Peptidyl-prolyl cis-trans isomerase n=1 Tax=Leptidea sinapis TaxID=189913 RepID=A0A5E4Q6T4_9NEOP|nr:unnamed protein product [Leptidea sinapis]
MSVVIETTLGDITVDLYLEQRPATCLNFLKLCKMKYYNYNLFHTIRSGFIAQTGDPSGDGSKGESIWGILEGPQKRYFSGEKRPKIRHSDAGLLSMVCTDDMMVGSQFFLTLAPDLDSLDGTHCVIGEVSEGHDVLNKFNEVICDENHRPYRDVRITHTVILNDPFNDPPGLIAPSRSPSPNAERLKGGRIAPDEEIDETEGKTAEELQEMIEEKEAKARATILEIVGDLPDADIAPPENVLFVCKLNPVTSDDDLEIIFSRFGKIVSCEVIRDKKTGNSLQYAFIEFADKKFCEDAYLKMDNVLIDDRRIHVDFSQSVSKMRWLGKGRGVQYLDDSQDEVISEKYSSRETDRRAREDRKYKTDSHSRDHRHDRRDHYENRIDRNFDKKSKDQLRQSSNSHSRTSQSQNKSYKTALEPDREKSHKNGQHINSYRNKNEHRSRSPIKNIKSQSPSRKQTNPSNEREIHDRSKIRKDYHSHSSRHEREKSRKSAHKGNGCDEPKTPSPTLQTKNEKENLQNKCKKNKHKLKENLKNKKISGKQRSSPSSSSSSESSSSTSSSDSSSSSESDRKRKKIVKKKRKYSTSSSSSSSTSSSSSSTSSSDSSSSDGHISRKRRKKNGTKKTSSKVTKSK